MGRYQDRYTNDDYQILDYSAVGELKLEVWKMMGVSPTYELALCMMFRHRMFLIAHVPISEAQATGSASLDEAVDELLSKWWPTETD